MMDNTFDRAAEDEWGYVCVSGEWRIVLNCTAWGQFARHCLGFGSATALPGLSQGPNFTRTISEKIVPSESSHGDDDLSKGKVRTKIDAD